MLPYNCRMMKNEEFEVDDSIKSMGLEKY